MGAWVHSMPAAAMPGLPGATTTSAVRARTWARACSRPPEPTTRTLIPPLARASLAPAPLARLQRDRLEPLGADADVAHRHPRALRQEQHVVPGVGGELLDR